jgi:Sulfotransferase family
VEHGSRPAPAPQSRSQQRLETARLRARRRRVRTARRRTVAVLLRLAPRTEQWPLLSRTVRTAAHRLDAASKRVERVLRAPAGTTFEVAYAPDPAAAVEELRTLIRIRAKRLVPVEQPLVLISQAPRSGGTLLMRLFDGHPECHAVPHELGAMLPSALPLPREPEAAWRALTDPRLAKAFEVGLRQAKRRQAEDRSWQQFLLPPLVHRGLFEQCLRERLPGTDRGVLDCYLTAYFNARLDYPGLRRRPAQRWVTGFEPDAVGRRRRMACFRELYPDGRLISVVRDPTTWVVSARRRPERYPDLRLAMGVWKEAVLATLEQRERDPEGVAILPFEALVADTERTMRSVAGFLGIEFRGELLAPTFDGAPMKANSSFPVERAGVIEGPLTRAAELDDPDRERVRRELGELHARALEVALVRP